MATEVVEGSGGGLIKDEVDLVTDGCGIRGIDDEDNVIVVGLIKDEITDECCIGGMSDGKVHVIGKNVCEKKTAGQGKQHSEEFEQYGPIELHDSEPANTAMALSLLNPI